MLNVSDLTQVYNVKRHCGNLVLLLQCCDDADTHSFDEAGPDLRSLGVQGDAHWPVVDAAWFEALASFTYVLDGLCVVLRKEMET